MSTSTTSNSAVLLTLPGGEFGFYPTISCTADAVANICGNGLDNGLIPGGGFGANVISLRNGGIGGGGANIIARQRYLISSPPYKIGTLDFGLFVYVHLDADGNIISLSTATDPTWWILNPVPDDIDSQGNKYYTRKNVPNSVKALKKHNYVDYVKKLKKIKSEKIKVTTESKNQYMDTLPHPFHNVKEGERVILLSPSESAAELLFDLHQEGESVNQIIHDDYISIDDEVDAVCPKGVKIHKFRFKSTG